MVINDYIYVTHMYRLTYEMKKISKYYIALIFSLIGVFVLSYVVIPEILILKIYSTILLGVCLLNCLVIPFKIYSIKHEDKREVHLE
ncbi:hypothetical protein AVL50_11870 [Flammeovirga sp. SJP92]|nr:hypothetical protein AVL50_11870 [Flammeovirga sp. SJP92]